MITKIFSMLLRLTVILLLCVSTTLLAQSTIETIPNQKLINGSYVSDPDHILEATTILQIDTLLASLEKKTSVQVAVVLVQSIGDAEIVDFAQQLFVKWGIGSKGNDNGLLVLFAKDQHTIRFHTGYGVEGMLPDVICKRIQREFMVPEFKNGKYDAGILAGLQEVSKILTNPTNTEELKTSEEEEPGTWSGFVLFLAIFLAPILVIAYFTHAVNNRFSNAKSPEYTPYPEMRFTRWGWLLEFGGVPLLIVILFSLNPSESAKGFCIFSLYFYFMGTLFHRLVRMKRVMNRFLANQEYYEIVEFIRKSQVYWFFMGLLFPVPFFLYFFYHLARKRLYRNHSRSCANCGGQMQKLSENKEDQFLSKSQQLEETLRTVDYDVWQCTACQATQEWNYPSRSSKYEACPKCKTIAYYQTGRRTLKAATYSSSGKGEEMHECKFCSYKNTSTYTIAQLVVASSSDSGSSSSSSSSGGSWGGGSSGGGGASSSW